ncbi:glutathione S-transferase family protein [Yoonia sp. SS1-5]|uniref:glutathione transferase n=1 Tax=Yoonia rhodophyticola TaxID=3137370 RepID=A0AAN0MCA7_9RHOB
MSDVIIFGLPPSSYVRTALMVCESKGVAYRLQPVDFRDPAYRAQHPFGKMPAMQHGDVTLYEALAIATYVDEVLDGPALQPADPVGRARMLQWVSATNDYIYDSVVRHCVTERFVKPMRGLEPDTDLIAAALPRITEHVSIMDDALDGSDYLCGAKLSLADLFLAPVMHYLAATPEGRDLLPSRKNIVAWQSRMADTPKFDQINSLG